MSQRYEREIDEILRQFEGGASSAPRPLRRPAPRAGARQRFLQTFWSAYSLRWRWSSVEVMLAAYAFTLIALAVSSLPLFHILAWPVGLAAVLLFVAGYVGGYRRWTRPARSWRGRPVTYGQPALSDLWSQLRFRWQRRRR